ncbi:MAG: polysaccharide deacetylase family protein [Candidatus Omnitrophota bacterium]|nr:polysaccharide deacetylase family protein [Candidatus Omnitrophota bacterium]
MRKGSKRILLTVGILAVAITIVLSAVSLKIAYVVPILMYHSIDYNDKASKLSVSPESFARQMEFLYKNHYNVIPLEKAIPYIQKRQKPPRKTIAITLDDGLSNNYLYAYPVLKKYNIPAAIFVIVNRVGGPGFLSWDQIKEMSDSGIVTIGSHTRAHFWLLGSDERFLKDEVVGSKNILEEKLGKKVGLFCYPMGAFDEKSKKAVKDAGYVCAVSTNPKSGPTDIYAIKRVKISRSADNLLVFWAETTRFYTWLKRRKEAE